jgi:hypothetical protein
MWTAMRGVRRWWAMVTWSAVESSVSRWSPMGAGKVQSTVLGVAGGGANPPSV